MAVQQQQQQQQQQNSTFIDNNPESCTPLLNFPDSPILPPKNRHRRQNQDSTHPKKPSANLLIDAKVTAPNAFIDAPPPTQRGQNKHGNMANGNGNGNGQHMVTSRRHRHRFVSLCGANSTVEQCDKELPIWLNHNELRYVSGVTNKTTCNDIIKALIDDEQCNNNNSNINNKPDGDHGSGAALRDYNDFVITERWRGIERSYDGNMAILPVWRAWSRVHNELCLSLKQRQQLKESLPPQYGEITPSASTGFSMLKWLKRLLHFGSNKKHKTYAKKTSAKVANQIRENWLPPKRKLRNEMLDEVLLVILPDQHYENYNRNVKAQLNSCELTTKHRKNNREKITTSDKFVSNHCIRRRRKDAPLRNSLRNKLAALHAEMNMRYEREYNLTRQLTDKCRQFKLQNERYRCREIDLSVSQLQQNIEAYAEDIIRTEHELLELKNEIKQDISLINNLKRMTLGEDKETVQVAQAVPHEMQFVDNIYEFCDNNASMLV